MKKLFSGKKGSILSVSLAVIIILCSVVRVSAQGTILNKAGSIVKIVSYNIWTNLMSGTDNALELRAARLKQVIFQYKPDSIGFQEARYEWMDWLGKNLTDYSYVGAGRENGKIDPKCGEATPIFYLKDKFKLLDSGTFWLSETPNTPSKGWDAAYIRICTWAVLQNNQTGECYAHVNTHLDNIGETARAEGIKLVLKKIDELGVTYPIVCTGDFNAAEYSETYNLIVDNGLRNSGVEMVDTLFCAEEVINRGGTMPDLSISPRDSELKANGKPAIDHCFASRDNFDVKLYKVMRDTVDNKYVSDHYGVYTELEFKKKDQENTYHASYGTADVDGIMDTSYNRSDIIRVSRCINDSLESMNHATARVKTIYDDAYIYCFAEVNDSSPNSKNTRPKNNIGVDGMQFFFDFIGGEKYTAGKGGYIIADLTATDNKKADGGVIRRAHQGFSTYSKGNQYDYKAIATEAGYNIELKLALPQSLKRRVANDEEGIQIRIGFQVNDDTNDDGIRDQLCFNDKNIYNAWELDGASLLKRIYLISED